MRGKPKYYCAPRKEIGMRVPDEIQKCVVFVGREGNHEIEYGGTSVIVGFLEDVNGRKFRVPYLVTAGHVARKLGSGTFWVRANTQTNAQDFEAGPAAGAVWRFHPDPKVDVAVCPWFIPTTIDGLPVNSDMFLTPESIKEYNIGIGDEVFVVGLFTKVKGQVRNIPIVRMGNLAMLPGEPVPTKLGKMDAYLIEARSIGGISGSPVFVRQTVFVSNTVHKWGTAEFVDVYAGGPFSVLGLIHGHWEIDPEDLNDPNIPWLGESEKGGVNLGIAIVIPAFKVLEAFMHPDLVKIRKKSIAEHLKRDGLPTVDSAIHERPSTNQD